MHVGPGIRDELFEFGEARRVVISDVLRDGEEKERQEDQYMRKTRERIERWCGQKMERNGRADLVDDEELIFDVDAEVVGCDDERVLWVLLHGSRNVLW